MKQLLFLFAAVLFTSMADAQPGTVDVSFGDNGFVYTNGLGYHYAVVQQADGKLVTAGGYTDADFNGLGDAARFLPDGTIDSSFGKNGYALNIQASEAYDMLLQKDGKIVIVGGLTLQDGGHSYVARLQTNGSFDSSFGGNGITLIPSYGDESDYLKIAMVADGSFIISGAGTTNPEELIPQYSLLSHLFVDGTFDVKFGGIGRVENRVAVIQIGTTGLAIQKDGKILQAGYNINGGDAQEDYVLTRYNPDGSLDNSFGTGGNIITQGVQGLTGQDQPCGIVVQPDGKILLGGTTAGYNFIVYMAALRYNPDGTLDNSFGTGGRSLVAFSGKSSVAGAILLQPDGKIILAGNAGDGKEGYFALARLNTDGSLDASFGIDGEQVTPFNESGDNGAGYIDGAYCATLQQDGKIVQGGSYYNLAEGFDNSLLVRYNNDIKGQSPLVAKLKHYLHNHGIGWQGLNANINYYSVQYCKTGNSFTEKGKVSGSGSSAFQQYNFNVADAGYYRVVAVDRKGYKTFSNKVTVSADDVASAASVFPNPAKDYVTVQGLKTNETASISIADGSGNVMARGVSNGSTQYRSPLTNMQPGTYYVNITTATKTETLKFVKE